MNINKNETLYCPLKDLKRCDFDSQPYLYKFVSLSLCSMPTIKKQKYCRYLQIFLQTLQILQMNMQIKAACMNLLTEELRICQTTELLVPLLKSYLKKKKKKGPHKC